MLNELFSNKDIFVTPITVVQGINIFLLYG